VGEPGSPRPLYPLSLIPQQAGTSTIRVGLGEGKEVLEMHWKGSQDSVFTQKRFNSLGRISPGSQRKHKAHIPPYLIILVKTTWHEHV
jgi:hypothetical protein